MVRTKPAGGGAAEGQGRGGGRREAGENDGGAVGFYGQAEAESDKW